MYIHSSLVDRILPSEDKDEPSEESTPHWFFKIELADGDVYALDLCTAQFASSLRQEPLTCVAPLHEHLQRLPVSQEGVTITLGFQRQILEEKQIKLPPEQVMAGEVRHDDVCCVAQKFALARLRAAILHWTSAQSTTLDKVLRLPETRYKHSFCTIVWPIELTERAMRADGALMIVNSIRKIAWESTAPDDYE